MRIKRNGFALLEMLMATILLSGIMYLFISFGQNNSKLVNKEIAGKHIAILINTILGKTFVGKMCLPDKTSGPLSKCLTIPDDVVKDLTEDGLDPTTATLTISSVKDHSNQAQLALSFNGNFFDLDGSIYAQQILENLSDTLRTHLSPELYNNFFSYTISKDTKTLTFNLSFMK